MEGEIDGMGGRGGPCMDRAPSTVHTGHLVRVKVADREAHCYFQSKGQYSPHVAHRGDVASWDLWWQW